MFKLFRKYLRGSISKILMVLGAVFLSTMANLSLPMLSKAIINAGIGKQDIRLIIIIAVVMFVVLVLSLIIMVSSNKISAGVSMSFSRDLRKAFFEHVSKLSQGDIEKIGISTLISRQTNDIMQLQVVLAQMLTMMLTAPLMCIGGIIMAILTAPELSWVIVLLLPVSLIMVIVILLQVNPLFKENQKKLDKVNLIMREVLNGMRVIRAFNREDQEVKRFEGTSKELMQTALKANTTMTILLPVMTFLVNAANILIIWFGSHYMRAGISTFGDIATFIQYVSLILMSLMMASMLMVTLPRAITSAGRINEVLEMESSIKDPLHPISFSKDKDILLCFEHVYYKYPGAEEYVLKDIDFEAKAGETIAIIGGTGAGKSTLINLISRFHDATKGKVIVDGIDVKDVLQEDLRNRLGIVPQKSFLFAGTIFDNIQYGKPDATGEEVNHALDIAQATEFISEKDYGIYTYITQSGGNVSGGQKQRLSIARALIRKPEIYIFDDSFSALDYKTDANLRAALKTEVKNSIMIIVALRVSTIMDADQIIVLDNGKIAGKGKHKELLKSCDLYREIALSQLSIEEVNG